MRKRNEKFNEYSINIYEWNHADPKAAILIVHGLDDHAGRYAGIAKHLNSNQISVWGLDLIGHGLSSGKRAYINRFDQYIDQVEAMSKIFESEHPDIPLFILGHSMGGLIVSITKAKQKLKRINSVILSNPALDIETGRSKILVYILQIFDKIAPKLPTKTLENHYRSRDPKVLQEFKDDPLNYGKAMFPRTLNEMNLAGKWMRKNAKLFDAELLICYSDADKMVYPFASPKFFENVSSKDKTIKNYSGLYHDLFNEGEKDLVLNDITNWINKRLLNSIK